MLYFMCISLSPFEFSQLICSRANIRGCDVNLVKTATDPVFGLVSILFPALMPFLVHFFNHVFLLSSVKYLQYDQLQLTHDAIGFTLRGSCASEAENAVEPITGNMTSIEITVQTAV